MPKPHPSAPGKHRVVEDHPIFDKPSVADDPLARGRAALRTWDAAPELKQRIMDKDMDLADSISNMFRKSNAQD